LPAYKKSHILIFEYAYAHITLSLVQDLRKAIIFCSDQGALHSEASGATQAWTKRRSFS